MLERSYEQIAAALEAGDLVCVFPEGHITETGELQPFRPGIERIIRSNPVPVIPMALRGLWGTFFSRKGGRAMSAFPTHLWSRISLAVGVAVAPEAVSAADLQQNVLALRGDWK